MNLWRISNYHTLDGRGGLTYSGRWHTAGRPVVYLADSSAGALLETLVHLNIDPEDVPRRFTLLRVEVSGSPPIQDLPLPSRGDWREQLLQTQAIGDNWLRTASEALIRVPSAIAPYSCNYLLNPLHPKAASVRIAEVLEDRYDLRLLKL